MASANIPDVNVNSAEGPTMAPDWMGNLPEKLHTVPLNSLAIPGSHNSFGFWLDKAGAFGPDTPRAITDLEKVFGGMVKDIVHKWSLSQTWTVAQQLEAGVRYFDIRLASKPGSEDLHTVHGLYGHSLQASLKDLQAFLVKHPREVLLLDFNHFCNVSEAQHRACIGLLTETFADKMAPLVDVASVTLEMLWENKLQVVIFYHHDIVSDHLQFWPADRVPAPWPKVADTAEMLKFLETNYKEGRAADKFHVTQGVLTPDPAYIMAHMTSSLRDCLCCKMAGPFVKWVNSKVAGSPSMGINICAMDFVDMANYIPTVLALND